MFKKQTNWGRKLAESQLDYLYLERDRYSPLTEEYQCLTARIKEETEAIKNLASAVASDKTKTKINWEPWIGAAVGVAGNITLAILTMQFQEKGHLPDFKIMGLFKSRG